MKIEIDRRSVSDNARANGTAATQATRCTAMLFMLTLAVHSGPAQAAELIERDQADVYFYDVPNDPIPWQPENNRHGPDYDIPDETWKVEADQRINEIRKSDLTVTLIDEDGNPVQGVPVRFELKRHAFPFGAVTTWGFGDAADGELTKQYLLKYMNAAGFGMGLKPTQCPVLGGDDGRTYRFRRVAEEDIPWLREHDFYIRGHTLVWDGQRFLHPNLKQIVADPNLSDHEKGTEIADRMKERIPHAVQKWDVQAWDVINEPRVNHLVDEMLPERDTMVEAFEEADEARRAAGRPDVKLYYNENQVLSWSRWGSYENNRDVYRDRIDDVIDAGAAIDGIGFQYRFKQPASPEVVWERMEDFADYGLPYQATEFELVEAARQPHGWTDRERKQMTAEMITIFFSHPLADGFWHWAYNQRDPSIESNAEERAPLISWEGEPTAEFEQWIKMMEVDFKTDETVKTDAEGNAEVRGFKGTYLITIGTGPAAAKYVLTLDEDTEVTARASVSQGDR
ncbi:MAG: endo-1,4-beta-xylanase [Planctomycetota bacterium]